MKGFQIRAVVREACLLGRPQGVCPVHLVPLSVVLGKGGHLKIAVVVQHANVLLRRAQLRNHHALRLCTDDLPLRRIVVREDQAVRQYIQPRRNFQNILTFRLPVRLYQNKVIRPQHAVRMIQTGQRVLLLIFGVHVQHDADVLQGLHIGLKFRIHLTHGGFLPDLQVLHTVVPHDAAPERIVQIQHQRLFIFPENGLDDVGNVQRQPRDGLQAQSILVHVPVKRIRPGVQPVGRGLITDVVEEKNLRIPGILREPFVEPPHEGRPPAGIHPVLIAKKPVKGLLHIVLDHGAVPFFPDPLPHRPEMPELLFQRRVRRRPVPAGRGPVRDIPVTGMDIDDIRMKSIQLLVSEHGVLPVLTVFRLIKHRLDPLVQKEQLQDPDYVMGGAPAKDGDPLFYPGRAVRKQLLSDTL